MHYWRKRELILYLWTTLMHYLLKTALFRLSVVTWWLLCLAIFCTQVNIDPDSIMVSAMAMGKTFTAIDLSVSESHLHLHWSSHVALFRSFAIKFSVIIFRWAESMEVICLWKVWNEMIKPTWKNTSNTNVFLTLCFLNFFFWNFWSFDTFS